MIECTFSKHHLIDPCENITCEITGEKCDGGVCKCGESNNTCAGDKKVNYCDFEKSKCMCAKNVDACSQGEKCIHGKCKGI